MSAYSTSDYEFSFAKRTLKNLEFIQKHVAKEKAEGKEDADISDAFEVTQLINSFVGLLIIPRQKCFKYLPDNIAFPRGSDAEQLLKKIKSSPSICEDTYFKQIYNSSTHKMEKTNEIEDITPKTLILRLRNAVAHDRLKIQPVSPGKNGIITGIEFSDTAGSKKNNNLESFRLLLTVKETEILVKALSELLLSCYHKARHKSLY